MVTFVISLFLSSAHVNNEVKKKHVKSVSKPVLTEMFLIKLAFSYLVSRWSIFLTTKSFRNEHAVLRDSLEQWKWKHFWYLSPI